MPLPDIELLPLELLVKTSEVDHADWNYRPLLGKLQRVRFQLVKSLLDGHRVDGEVLEIGYGSGVFFPELQKHFVRISGLDPHGMTEEVSGALAKAGIRAKLVSGGAASLPFSNAQFDSVVAVSALEYVSEIDQACREIIRVLKPGGTLVIVTPGKSPILDLGLRLVGGEDADSNYGDRRQHLLDALGRHFEIARRRNWPWPGIPWLTPYRALKLAPRNPQGTDIRRQS